MEAKNREEIIKIESDIAHIKKSTDKIEVAISELLKAQGDNSNQIIELRGRIREAEHDILSIKSDVKGTQSALWKVSITIAIISAGGAVGAESILKLIF